MDLQVCAIIAIVFCVSLISLIFINQKLRGGKSFEDVLAEKRQLAHLVGGSKYAKKAGARKANGDSNNRNGAKKESRKERKLKQEQERREQSPDEDDSDAGSESQSAASNSPAHSKGASDFSETEQLVAEELIAPAPQSKKTKKQQARKNSANAKQPAFSTVEPVAAIETANHFELPAPIQEVTAAAADVDTTKKSKALAKAKRGSPKTEKPIVAVVAAEPEQAVAAAIAEPIVTPKESPKHQTSDGKHKVDSKLNKKKRNEHANLLQHQAQQQLLSALITGGTDDVSVNTVMHLLGRADLSRSEIQIIIDYLLNKQQDTRTDHSDWSDDPLQKIKKQLQEREQALAEEQEASAGLQTKLREMRATINTLNAENRARTAEIERITVERQTEVQLLANDYRTVRERLESDHQRLVSTCTQLHEEVTKLQQQQEVGADATARLQQLADANAQLQLDIVGLQQTVQQQQSEAAQKGADYEAKVHELQVLSLQRDTDVTTMFAQHKEYVEQLKQELDEQMSRTKQLDDSSKVEIRNLQNALDSSNREANVCAQEANKWRQIHDELKAAASAELQQSVSEVRGQLAEREIAVQQAGQTVAQREAQIVQLQAQIGRNASQAATAEQQLNASAGEVKLRLGLETEKVKELTATLAEQSAILQGYKDQHREQEQRLIDLQAEVSEFQEKNNPQQLAEQQQQLASTRQLLDRLFPATSAAAPAVTYAEWLASLSQHIEQQQQQQLKLQQQQLQQLRDAATTSSSSSSSSANTSASAASNATTTVSNNVGKTATAKEAITNHTNHQTPAASNNHSADVKTTSEKTVSAEYADALILENATLQAAVEQYKKIVADTEGMLNRLETTVREHA